MPHHPARPAAVLAAVLALALVSGLAVRPAAAQAAADLAVTAAPSKKHLKFGASMTVTITVTNLGPDPATGVTLGAVVSDSLNPGPLVCPDGTVAEFGPCELGTLAPGASATATLTVIACCACCPEGVGVAIAGVDHDAGTADPNGENNAARVDFKITGRAPS